MNRKKYTYIFIVMAIILLIPFFTYAEKEGSLIIAGDSNFPPYEFLTEDGEYRGFNVDLMRALSIEIKRDIKLVPMSWMETYTALNSGEIDAIQGMNFNKQRKEIYDFSTPYIVNSSILFVRDENKEIFNYDDLKGKRVAVQRSGAAAYILAEMGEIEVVFFSDLEEAFIKLRDKKVDAVFGDKLAGTYILKEMNMEKHINTLGDGINKVDYGVAVKKGNEKLLNEINAGLERLKRNGTYNKIFDKWFGKENLFLWEQKRYYVYGIIGSILIALIIVGFYSRWNSSLKKEVDKRTQELSNLNKELKESQKVVKESDEFKQQIIDSLSIGLITFNDSNEITALNREAEKLFDLKREQAIGNSFNDLGLYDFFKISDMNKFINEQNKIVIDEIPYIKNGEKKYFNYLITPLKSETLQNIGGVTTFRDITEEKLIRRELVEKDKMHSLGRLIAGIAHEIRNPLTSIKAYLEALPIKYDNPKFRERITLQVPKEINRLNELLKELLEYSKPKNIEKTEFEINIIIGEIMNLLNSLIREKHIGVSINIEEGISVYGDKQKIKQVLINLLLNSIEALEDEGKINIDIYEEMEQTKISISDDGIGIDENSLGKIFEPFYTTKETGTGLGLLICYQCIKDNGGEIDINSKVGEGTTVTITLNKKNSEG